MMVMAVMRCQMCGCKKKIPIESRAEGLVCDFEGAKRAITKETVSFFKFHDCGNGNMGIMRIVGAEMVE